MLKFSKYIRMDGYTPLTLHKRTIAILKKVSITSENALKETFLC